jgi:hypothetical protein
MSSETSMLTSPLGPSASISSRKIPNCKFNLTVGKLSPVLDNCQLAVLGRLVNNFSNSASGSLERQPENLLVSHSGCQFPRARVHAGTPTLTDGSHIRPQDLEIAMRADICPRCSQRGVVQQPSFSATISAGISYRNAAFHPVLFRGSEPKPFALAGSKRIQNVKRKNADTHQKQ